MTKTQLEKILAGKGIGKFEITEEPPRTVILTVCNLWWFQFGRKRRIREARQWVDIYGLPVWMAALKVITDKGRILK